MYVIYINEACDDCCCITIGQYHCNLIICTGLYRSRYNHFVLYTYLAYTVELLLVWSSFVWSLENFFVFTVYQKLILMNCQIAVICLYTLLSLNSLRTKIRLTSLTIIITFYFSLKAMWSLTVWSIGWPRRVVRILLAETEPWEGTISASPSPMPRKPEFLACKTIK